MNDVLLSVKNLSCGYAGKAVLRNISFTASRGETITVLGPNGCGKTTLLKTIATSLAPLEGRILLGGRDIRGIERRERAGKVAVVMQNVENVHMTVEEYVLLGRTPHFKKFQFFESRTDNDLVDKFLHLTGTEMLKHMLFSRISGGEKQLVSIARALVQEPALLLLDEPTSHLDIFHQCRILDLVTRIKKDLRISVVMVLHDLNLACEYADRIVLLDSAEKGIYTTGEPAHAVTRQSVEAVYKADVCVAQNPVSHKPCIFIVNTEQETPAEDI